MYTKWCTSMNVVGRSVSKVSVLAALWADRCAVMVGSPIDSSIGLLQAQRHRVISFAMGCPGEDAIPSSAIREIALRLLEQDPAGPLNYGPTEGERSLREVLPSFLRRCINQSVSDEELLITSGGMQGLDLVFKLFINPGDVVAVEEPVYPNTSMAIRSYEGALLPVAMDEQGMQVELIPELIRASGKVPKIVNIIPNFQNPTGATLSLERRLLLIELARKYGFIILEDDPYGLLHFDESCPESVRTLSGNDPLVVAVHTFSKIFAPGLRVGWVAASAEIIRKMVDARQGMDTCTNVVGQRIIAEYCASGKLEAHIADLRGRYANKLTLMTEALDRAFADTGQASWMAPRGGFFMWLTLDPPLDTRTLFPAALEAGVAVIPGDAFSNVDAGENGLRLCFAYPDPAEIGEGVRTLARVIASLPRR
jgi:2-aminoadipate transaminase